MSSRPVPRRPTAVLLITVLAVLTGILLVVFFVRLSNQPGGKVNIGNQQYDVGKAANIAPSIAKQGPLLFPALRGQLVIYLQHLGSDPGHGWLAFDAHAPDEGLTCLLRWSQSSGHFTDPCQRPGVPGRRRRARISTPPGWTTEATWWWTCARASARCHPSPLRPAPEPGEGSRRDPRDAANLTRAANTVRCRVRSTCRSPPQGAPARPPADSPVTWTPDEAPARSHPVGPWSPPPPEAGPGPREKRPAGGLSVRPATVRRWPRRVLIATNVLVAITLVGALSAYGYVGWRLGQIKRISIPSLGSHPAAGAGSPMTILIVGSDSRAGLSGQDTQSFGSATQVTGQRSDTIMLLRVDPRSTAAALLSIPRDLWVPIPGKAYSQRINTTFDTGPDLLVRAIQQNLGIPVDHYMEVSFNTFRQITNAVNGVKQYFPTPARDTYSGLSIPAAGCYNLTGDQALAFVRSRHYEYFANGHWQFEAESDLARIRRQQDFVKKMIAKAQGSGLTNPFRLNSIVSAVANNLTVDKGFSRSTMLSLAKRFRSLSPAALPTSTLPTNPAVIQGNDVLLLKQPDASTAIAQFLGQPPCHRDRFKLTTPAGSAGRAVPRSGEGRHRERHRPARAGGPGRQRPSRPRVRRHLDRHRVARKARQPPWSVMGPRRPARPPW